MILKKRLIFLIVLCVLLESCSFNNSTGSAEDSKGGNRKVSLACWNAQTFFDAQIDGIEYEDYRNYSKWSKEKYLKRLGRLCDVMTAMNPDIFVLEEIENTSVIQDISNQLAGKNWNQKNNWNYACFARETGASIGCAVFSRFPLEEMKVHSLDIRTQNDVQPSSRPVLEVSININGEKIVLFVNHWKSKSGGEDETEIWRDWQESVCSRLAGKSTTDGNLRMVFCGDFNRDATDFCRVYNGNAVTDKILLRGTSKKIKVFLPWFNSYGGYSTEIGSYYYEDSWERIDHIFTAGNLLLSAFSPRAEEPWCFSNSIPNSYKIYSGEGFSDHIPLMCILVF